MATSPFFYFNGKLNTLRGIDLSVGGTSNFNVALVTSSYTPNVSTDAVWATVSANEVSGVTGYTAGGQGLNAPTLTLSGSTVTFAEGTNTVWNISGGSTLTCRYAVLYANGTFNTLVNPLIAYYLLDNSPANVVVSSGNSLTIAWNASGIITWT
jgi:hypothetical protein